MIYDLRFVEREVFVPLPQPNNYGHDIGVRTTVKILQVRTCEIALTNTVFPHNISDWQDVPVVPCGQADDVKEGL